MELAKFVMLLLVALLVQFYGAPASAPSSREDAEMWRSWQDPPPDKGINVWLADLIKRSKSQQFHGLMGRSTGLSSGPPPPKRTGRKSNKGEMFVGLMGRRSSAGDVEEEWQSEY